MSGDLLEIDPRQKVLRYRAENAWLKTLLVISRVCPSPNSFKQHPTRGLDVLCPEALEATPYDGFEDAPTHATPYVDFVRGAFRSPLNNTRRWFWQWGVSKHFK